MITGEMRSAKPPEVRGGILSDEMGMGKSLTLIALIVRTLDIARSSEQHSIRHIARKQPNEPYKKSTIIIAPKSSTIYLNSSSSPFANIFASSVWLGNGN